MTTMGMFSEFNLFVWSCHTLTLTCIYAICASGNDPRKHPWLADIFDPSSTCLHTLHLYL